MRSARFLNYRPYNPHNPYKKGADTRSADSLHNATIRQLV